MDSSGIYNPEDTELIATAHAMQTELRLLQDKIKNMDNLIRRLAWALITIRRSQEEGVTAPVQALDIADECEFAMTGRSLGVTLRSTSYSN